LFGGIAGISVEKGLPGFPVETRGVDQHLAVFLRKTAYVVVASSAKWEIQVRSGRDDKG
jgi:hypothetical protein